MEEKNYCKYSSICQYYQTWSYRFKLDICKERIEVPECAFYKKYSILEEKLSKEVNNEKHTNKTD